MKKIQFTKMHGAGNDYVYINGFEVVPKNLSELAIKMSDRHFGIGSDGIVLILPSEKCDFKMKMFNSDGSEAEMCGNASRCVGKYVSDHGMTDKKRFTLETLAGTIGIELLDGNELRRNVQIDMGEPILDPLKIPVNINKGEGNKTTLIVDNQSWDITCVSMGNPHAVIFTTGIDSLNLKKIGPQFETNPIFPQKTNTEFVEQISPNQLKMRVWERGAGETLACGTGACATVVAGVLNGLCERKTKVTLRGGELEIEWDAASNHVFMSGEAVTVFDGTYFEE